MKNWTLAFIVLTLPFISSCATSMTPSQVTQKLPTLTKSTLLTQSEAEEKIRTGKCKLLVKNRKYVAPVKITSKQDLKHGAKGIDEWVTIDGGNAYVLKNYKWVIVDDYGSTQLQVNFDTILCE